MSPALFVAAAAARAGVTAGAAKDQVMETFTIREAAERCELSYQAMRKKVDRGTVRVVKHDGVRRIPRAELERARLWPGARADDAPDVAALREETERLRRDLASHRQLTKRAQTVADVERQARELTEQELHRERAERLSAEQRLQLLVGARWRERRRILRELRSAQAA